jgi:integrase/recombinase XerD
MSQTWRSLSKWAGRKIVSKVDAELTHRQWIAKTGLYRSSLQKNHGVWFVVYNPDSGPSGSLTNFIQDYLDDQYKHVTRHTWRNLSLFLTRFRDYCVAQKLYNIGDIKRRHVEQFGDQLPESNGPVSRRRHLESVRAALNRAVDWEIIEFNPAQRIRMPIDRATHERRALEDSEIVTIQRDWPTPFREWSMLGIWAGLRRSEATYLAWTDVDLGVGTIAVTSKKDFEFQPKGTRYRDGSPDVVAVVPWLLVALAPLPRVGRFVFDDGQDQPLYHENTWYKNIVRLAAASGMVGVTPHVFRHTFCTRAALSGVERTVLAKIARHHDASTTDRYVHSTLIDQRRELGKLSPVS